MKSRKPGAVCHSPSLRRAELRDAPNIARLESYWPSAPHWSESQIKEELARADSVFWVAEENGAAVAHAFGRVFDSELQILSLAVRSENARRGLGGALLRILLNEGARRGCRRAGLEVSTDNAAALRLYKNAGFQAVGRRPRFYPDGSDAVLMDRSLTEETERKGKQEKENESNGNSKCRSPLIAFLFVSLLFSSFLSVSSFAVPNRSSEADYIRALLDEANHDPKSALKEYARAIHEDPGSDILISAGAEAALESGKAREAEEWARQAVALSSSDAENYRILGQALWASDDLAGAEAALEKAIAIDPLSADAVYALETITAQTSLERARAILENFIDRSPDDAPNAYLELANLDLKGKDFDSAVVDLKKSIAADPDTDSLPARFVLARVYETLYSTASTLNEYKSILSLAPRNVPALDQMAEFETRLGRPGSAEALFEKAVAVSPGDPEACYQLAVADENRNDFAQAARRLRSSTALWRDPLTALRLSYDLTQEGKARDAVSVLERAHEVWPHDAPIDYFLSLGLDDLKRDKEAAAILKAGLSAAPDDADIRYQLAVVLEKNGDIAGAEKELRALLDSDPNDPEILNYLGYFLAERGLQLEEAESLIEKAVHLDPKNGAYLDSLGWVYYQEKRFPEALSELRLAFKSLPEDATVWEHAGFVFAALEKPEKAWLCWKMSVFFSDGASSSASQAEKIQGRLDRAQAGRAFKEYLSAVQGGVSGLDASCDFTVSILGRRRSLPALCSFEEPSDFSIEVLGPLFSPILDIAVSSGGFTTGTLAIRGLSPLRVRRALRRSLELIRDYFSAEPFSAEPARYFKRFGRAWLRSGSWRVGLDKKEIRAESFRSGEFPDLTLTIQGFQRTSGRLLPRSMEIKGPDFKATLTLSAGRAQFDPPVWNDPGWPGP